MGERWETGEIGEEGGGEGERDFTAAKSSNVHSHIHTSPCIHTTHSIKLCLFCRR
jgi:hypothetical protein